MMFGRKRPTYDPKRVSYQVSKVRASRAIFMGTNEIHEIEMKLELEDGSVATFQMPARLAAELISQLAVAYEAILPQNPVRIGSIARASEQWGSGA